MGVLPTDPPPRLLLYGAGGLGRELAWLVEQIDLAGRPCKVEGFISDLPSEQGGVVDDLPVWSLDEATQRHPEVPIVLAVGDPRARLSLARRLEVAGAGSGVLIHPGTPCSSRNDLGPGCILQVGVYLSVGIHVGPHVLLNGNITVGHDARIGACSVLGPGTRVSGNVHVGEGVLIGTGVTIIEGRPGRPLRIGDRAIVGAGACVISDVPPDTLVVGVPARPLRRV